MRIAGCGQERDQSETHEPSKASRDQGLKQTDPTDHGTKCKPEANSDHAPNAKE